MFICLGRAHCPLAPREVLLLGSVALFLFSCLAPAQWGHVRCVATPAFLLALWSSRAQHIVKQNVCISLVCLAVKRMGLFQERDVLEGGRKLMNDIMRT